VLLALLTPPTTTRMSVMIGTYMVGMESKYALVDVIVLEKTERLSRRSLVCLRGM
jgi:hypothetical protein